MDDSDKENVVPNIFWIILIVVLFIVCLCTIENKNEEIAADEIEKYEIIKRNGSAMDAYLQADLISRLFLDKKDEVNYKKWKTIKYCEGIRAELPSVLNEEINQTD